MIFLSKQLVQSCFLDIGYSPLDYLSVEQIQKGLNQLNQEQFDKQTFQEMQEQCRNNSRGQIKLQDMVEIFLKAEKILVQREQQLKRAIIKTQYDAKAINRPGMVNDQMLNQEQKLQEQVAELRQELVTNAINLEIIRKPFSNKNFALSIRKKSAERFPARLQHEQQQAQFPIKGMLLPSNTKTFTWIFQLVALLMLIQLPCLLYSNNFINILLLSLILLNFFTGYFCRTILRIWMYLLLASILVDIVWYIVGVKSIWNPNYNDWTKQIRPYLKLTIALYSVIAFGKIILVGLFLSQYNTDETEKKKISVFGFYELELSHDQITKNVFYMLNKTSHPFQAQLHI